jgi:PAS domain S-box-containing protein
MPIGDQAYDGWARIFWSVFERSTNPIWLLDFHRVYLEVNSAYCQLLGVSRGDLIGQRIDPRMVPADRARLANAWRVLWETGDWVSERTLIRADGSLVHVRLAVRTADVGEQTIAVAVCTRADTEELSCPPERLGELTSRECEIVGLVALGNTSPDRQSACDLYRHRPYPHPQRRGENRREDPRTASRDRTG